MAANGIKNRAGRAVKNAAGDATKKAATQAIRKGADIALNAAGAAIGLPPGTAKPLLGAIIGFAVGLLIFGIGIIMATVTAVNGYKDRVRHMSVDPSNGGALNAMSVMASNATIYVRLVYPGGSDCTSKYGGQYLFVKDTTEVGCSAVTGAQRADATFKIGVKLGGTFYEGAAAANAPSMFPGSDKFAGSPSVAQGTTIWLDIPGYHNSPTGNPSVSVPVVDVIKNASPVAKGPNNEDMTLRFDLLVKDGTEQTALINAWKAAGNCKTPAQSTNLYDCAVTGVTIKSGNPTSGPTSAPSTEEAGQFTGTGFEVDQSLRFQPPFNDPKGINNYYAKPTYIVLHYLGEILHYLGETPEGGTRPLTAREAHEYFRGLISDGNADNNKYVQFVIAQDGKIYQMLAETKKAAGACGFNLMPDGIGISISIENEGNFEKGAERNIDALKYTSAQVTSNAKLIKYLMNKWHIPLSHVVTHKWAWENYGTKGELAGGGACPAKSDPGEPFYQAVKDALQ